MITPPYIEKYTSGFPIASGLSLILLIISVLRGIRFPNLWSYSHFLFNYSHGFVKRGLVGEGVCRLPNPFYQSYEFFFYFSLVLLLLNLGLIWSWARVLIRSGNRLLVSVAFMFVSSLGVVYLAHTIGYFDQIGFLLCLIGLKISGFYKRLFFFACTFPPVIFIHEAIFIEFFPVIWVSLLLDLVNARGEKGFRIKGIFLGGFTFSLLFLVLFLGQAHLPATQSQDLYALLQSGSDYPLRIDAFEVLSRNGWDNLQIMVRLWSAPARWGALFLSSLVTAPLFLSFIFSSCWLLRQAGSRGFLLGLSGLASLSPLLLHLLGYDMHRWNTLTITTSFLMCCAVFKFVGPSRCPQVGSPIFFIMAGFLYLNGISALPLMDECRMKSFPFYEHQHFIRDVLTGNAGLIQVSEKW